MGVNAFCLEVHWRQLDALNSSDWVSASSELQCPSMFYLQCITSFAKNKAYKNIAQEQQTTATVSCNNR